MKPFPYVGKVRSQHAIVPDLKYEEARTFVNDDDFIEHRETHGTPPMLRSLRTTRPLLTEFTGGRVPSRLFD